MEQSIFGFAQQMLNEEKENLKWQQQNLEQAVNNFLKDQQFALREKENTIRLLHPNNVLARGYAIVKRKEKIITNVQQLKTADEIEITMRDGKAISIIKNIENEK
jgi:exodeoxyribonuclease VII large subunit